MKEIKIKIEKLIELHLSLEMYALLYVLYNKSEVLLTEYIKVCGKLATESIERLKYDAYIEAECDSNGKYLLSKITLTDKAKTLFIEVKTSNVDEWILDWYELWPKATKSGGYMIQSDPKSCLKKMIKFCEDYPMYSKGIIITATKKYIGQMRIKNWAYCKLAHYFIYKREGGMDISSLEGFCAALLKDNNVQEDIIYNDVIL